MSNQILIQLLGALPIFQHLSDEELRILAFIGERREHISQEVLYDARHISDEAILVSAGKMIIHYNTQHKRNIVAQRGTLTNELSLFSTKQYDYDVVALEKVTSYHFMRRDFMHLMEDFPEIAHKIQHNIIDRFTPFLAVTAN